MKLNHFVYLNEPNLGELACRSLAKSSCLSYTCNSEALVSYQYGPKAFLDFTDTAGRTISFCNLKTIDFYERKADKLVIYNQIKPPDLEWLRRSLPAPTRKGRNRKLSNSFPIFSYCVEEELRTLCVSSVFFVGLYEMERDYKMLALYCLPGVWSLQDMHTINLDQFNLLRTVSHSQTNETFCHVYHLMT